MLFCGINPSLYAGATGHHFSRPGNRFWPTLHAAGFTDVRLRPADGERLLEFGYGMTNLVERATAGADELSAAEQRGRARALEALGDPRYLRLLDDLDTLVRDRPMTDEGARPARDVFPRLVRRDAKRLRRAVRTARQAEPGEAHDAALHHARKKAKRRSIACEACMRFA